jgi:superfamily II DNA or RNA helicase
VRQFLDRQTDDIKIVFCTYQSAKVVGKAMQPGEAFDFAVFDEAHKTAGQDGSMSSYALADKNLCIRKRLFLTATPRHIDIRHRNKEGDFKVQSMDDAAVYGPRAYTLSFAAAAKKGIICRYKVIISLIDKKMVSDFARKHGITLVERDEISARWVANLIALKQAVEKVGASKIITFHSRVIMAEEFAGHGPRGMADLLDGYDVRHVNGSQSSVERGDIMRAFAEAPKSMLTNARCLTEGVNIPAVDMVAFIDPKQSRVDIAQAVGRAMRKPRGQTSKTVGYVVVPLFAGMDERDSLENAVHGENFGVVADVLNALQEHDEELVEIIREMKERKGRGERFDPRRLNENVQVLGPLVELDQLSASIAVEVMDRIGVSWDEYFGQLKTYRDRSGDCNISTYSEDKPLGRWVAYQRICKSEGRLSELRINRLNNLGFNWDWQSLKAKETWMKFYRELENYAREHDNPHVPTRWPSNTKLANWVWIQRQRRKGTYKPNGKDFVLLSAEQISLLDKLGFWDARVDKWAERFDQLKRFKEKYGHCEVARVKGEDSELSEWASIQRSRNSSGKLQTEQKAKMDSIGFPWASEDKIEVKWQEMYEQLKTYHSEHGDTDVPGRWKENPKLATWVATQRARKKQGDLSDEQIQLLDKLGFTWKSRDRGTWEDRLAEVVVFKAKYGHCKIPMPFPENPKLGHFVNSMRTQHNAGKLSPERVAKLEAHGFVWKSPRKGRGGGHAHSAAN